MLSFMLQLLFAGSSEHLVIISVDYFIEKKK